MSRLIALALVVLLSVFATVQPVHAAAPEQSPAPQPTAVPPGGEPEQPGIIQRIINTIQATIFFPAKTFQLAVEGAARATFTQQIREMRGPLMGVLSVMNFQTVAMDAGVANVAANMTKAAVPLWMLSLALMLLAVITRQATGSGYGQGMLGEELVKWFLICALSGNAYPLILKTHEAFAALTAAALGGTNAAPGLADKLLMVSAAATPAPAGANAIPLLILMVGVIVALITTITLALAYAARVAMLFAVAAVGPLCIACEGIPPLRFICRDWLGMFLRVELVGVLNAVILTLGGTILSSLSLTGGGLIGLAGAVGLAAALIAVNVSVFNQVFGTAVSIAGRVGDAVGSVVALAAGVGMLGATGGLGALGAARGGSAALGGATGGDVAGALPAPGETYGSGANGPGEGAYSAGGYGMSGAQTRGQGDMGQGARASASQSMSTASARGGGSRAFSAASASALPTQGALKAAAIAHVLGSATGSRIARAAAAGGYMGSQVARQIEGAETHVAQGQAAQAADFGARSERDKSAVASRLSSGVAGMSQAQTAQAAQAAAPVMRDMTAQMGGTAQVTHALGANDFGDAAAQMTSYAGATQGWAQGPDLASRLQEVPADAGSWNDMQYQDYGLGLEVARQTGDMDQALAWSHRAHWMRTQDSTGALTDMFKQNLASHGDKFGAREAEQALRQAIERNPFVGGASPDTTFSNAMLHAPGRGGGRTRQAGAPNAAPPRVAR